MTLITRSNEHINSGKGSICGGTIITPTAAVTASHCICGTLDPKIPQNFRRFTDCVGGDSNSIKNPPNEVRSRNQRHFNEITAGIGDKDKTRLTKINILVANVMGEFRPHEPSVGIFFDIGLVMTTDESGHGSVFYQHTIHTMSKGNIRVGSLCLAAKKDDEPYTYTGSILSVGWGKRYSDVQTAENKPQANKHSCTTNEFGPSSASFRHCNVDDVLSNPNDVKCKRQDMPKGYDAQKCKRYLYEAEKAMRMKFRNIDDSLRTTMSDIWTLTNMIEILPFVKRSLIGASREIRNICYKQKLFDDHGWCYVDLNTKEWGFCGSSCEFLNTKLIDTQPDIYHKMIWEYPPRPNLQSRCTRYVDNYVIKPWYICVEPLAPQASVFQFKRAGLRRLELINPSKDDPIRAGYQLLCKADSGSGNWMMNSNENKRALVAIYSYSTGDFCGDSSHAITTVHPIVLDWIKHHSKIGEREVL